MDYSNDNSYDISDQNESNIPNGSDFKNESDSGCGSNVGVYANSHYQNSPFASSAVYTSSSLAAYASAVLFCLFIESRYFGFLLLFYYYRLIKNKKVAVYIVRVLRCGGIRNTKDGIQMIHKLVHTS